MNTLLERFLRYVKMDTQSDPLSRTCPSTKKQFDLANQLKDELQSIGLKHVNLDSNCYLTAVLPSNSEKVLPVIGLLAHLDTSPDFSGKEVKPQVIENYQGQDIHFHKSVKTSLSPKEFPELLNYIGQTLICTDGTTLLGADDKAGIAEIITAIDYLIQHPEIKHGEVRLGFTPDEEIGRGADKFDVKRFAANFAYTIDGGPLGELEYENFNAAYANVKIQGRNVHPGTAKGKMLNSILVGQEFNSLLPVFDRPEFTQDYEGFFHLISFKGTVEQSEFEYIIRDHDRSKFEGRKEMLKKAQEFIHAKYGAGVVSLELSDQYYNMREELEKHFQIVELAEKAMISVGVQPLIKPIRGGTDGSKLSFMGLPSPNLFTGGHNYHGKYEFISLEAMQKAVEVIVKLVSIPAESNEGFFSR